MPRLSDEQRAMVADHWPDTLRVASWFAGRYPTLGVDWTGAVGLALCHAALGYRGGLHTTFRTHAFRRARGACLDAMREARARGMDYQKCGDRPIVLTTERPAPIDGIATTLGETLADGAPPVGWEVEAEDEVLGMCRRLPADAAAVVRLRYLHGLTIDRTARRMRVRDRYVCELHGEALTRLREAI